MFRIDTLRTFLVALVPAAALLGGCAGTSDATDPNGEPSNGGQTEGTEADDQGYASAIVVDAKDTKDDVGSTSQALTTGSNASIFLREVQREYGFLNQPASYYTHTTYMNESTGTRRTDCSGYLGYALNRVLPSVYAEVPHPSTVKPLAADWYNFLSTRSATNPTTHFRRVLHVADLQPGDIIAWLQPPTVSSENTGHVLIVTGAPRAGRTDKHEILVPIADSTESPHATDSRGSSYTGVGTGTLGLQVDAYGAPVAYLWRGGVSTTAVPTKIALGHID